MEFKNIYLPGLYRSADITAIKAQNDYFFALKGYLLVLISGALFAYISSRNKEATYFIISGGFFFLSILIMIWFKIQKPNDLWYNGRAVAESVKTRAWRWMMRAEPYEDKENKEIHKRAFILDLSTILELNPILHNKYELSDHTQEPITKEMVQVRNLTLSDRFDFYLEERIGDQQKWYYKKSIDFKRQTAYWFWFAISLHAIAILLIGINIKYPTYELPIEVIAVLASSALTWIESKKLNDLATSYTLTVQEISMIKAERDEVESEKEFSEYVINCENAFSREHTQWFARKSK